jgi:hypothetical protein
MPQSSFKCQACDVIADRAASIQSEICAADSSVNDNEPPPVNSISFTDLALAMQLDEDSLLQRFAAILSKRDIVSVSPSTSDEGKE